MNVSGKFLVLILPILPLACGPTTSQPLSVLRLEQTDATADFDVFAENFTAYYGALSFKERHFGFRLADRLRQTRSEVAQSRDDAAVFAALHKFLGAFHDGHLRLTLPPNAARVESYDLPLAAAPVDGHFVIGALFSGGTNLGIKVGDELLEVDGQSPADLLPLITKYQHLGTPAADANWIYYALRRPFYMREITPKDSLAQLTLQRADGSVYKLALAWRLTKGDQSADGSPERASRSIEVAAESGTTRKNSVAADSSPTPFFATPQVAAAFKLKLVKPSDASLKRYGVEATFAPQIFAALYHYAGKTILLVRQASYVPPIGVSVETMIQTYKAIFATFESQADVLVLDQTENGGGLGSTYGRAFLSLFLKEKIPEPVTFLHADRRWLEAFQAQQQDAEKAGQHDAALAYQADAAAVAAALARGDELTPPLGAGVGYYEPDREYTWRKPMLVLIDELAGSAAEGLPMLVKRYHLAPLFGHTTSGSGGTYEVVAQLPHSHAVLGLNRGLFTYARPDGRYTDADFVENQGVPPDIAHSISLAELRAGFVGYVDDFSRAAVAQAFARTP